MPNICTNKIDYYCSFFYHESIWSHANTYPQKFPILMFEFAQVVLVLNSSCPEAHSWSMKTTLAVTILKLVGNPTQKRAFEKKREESWWMPFMDCSPVRESCYDPVRDFSIWLLLRHSFCIGCPVQIALWLPNVFSLHIETPYIYWLLHRETYKKGKENATSSSSQRFNSPSHNR